jgi:hypothetical protein
VNMNTCSHYDPYNASPPSSRHCPMPFWQLDPL